MIVVRLYFAPGQHMPACETVNPVLLSDTKTDQNEVLPQAHRTSDMSCVGSDPPQPLTGHFREV